MVSKTFSLSIFQKLLLGMLFSAMIPLGGLWYISIYKSEQDWNKIIKQDLSKSVDLLANKVDDWVAMNIQALRQNALLEDIISMDPSRQNPILKSMSDAYPWIYVAFTVDLDGQNIGRGDGKHTRYYGDREYFKQVINGSEVGQQVIISRTHGVPALILCTPITSSITQKMVGIIGMGVTLVDVSKSVVDTEIGETGFAILLDSTGKAVAHGEPETLTRTLQDMSDHPILQQNKFEEPIIYNENGEKVVAYAKKTRQGWILIVQQNYDDAFASLLSARREALILLAATLVVLLIVAYVLAQRLADPIRNLTSVADSMSRGDLSVKVADTERGDEIGALTRAVERMGVSLQMAFERLQK